MGIDVSYESPTFSPALRFLPWQFSLRQVVFDVIHPSLYGLPLLLFPGTSIAITVLSTVSFYLLNSCPYRFNLLSCSFLDISPTSAVPLIPSFIIMSTLVTPHIHINILIPTASNFFSCAFFTAHVSAPYIMAGLPTTVLYTSPDSQCYSSVTWDPRYTFPFVLSCL